MNDLKSKQLVEPLPVLNGHTYKVVSGDALQPATQSGWDFVESLQNGMFLVRCARGSEDYEAIRKQVSAHVAYEVALCNSLEDTFTNLERLRQKLHKDHIKAQGTAGMDNSGPLKVHLLAPITKELEDITRSFRHALDNIKSQRFEEKK